MRALLIEDNAPFGQSIVRSLAKAGFTVDHFETVEDGWHAWRSVDYDAVILDIMLGDDSGLELLAKARTGGLRTPVLMLTALGRVEHRVQGLDKGADDYLVKPFAIEELVARTRALGRRPVLTGEASLRYGDVEYDYGARETTVRAERIALSRAESIVLERILRHPDRVITKAQLGEALHNLDQEYSDNSLQVHVHRLRRKMTEVDSTVTIRALRGIGYIAARTEPGTTAED